MRAQPFVNLALSVRQRIDLGGQQNAFGSNSQGFIPDQELQSNLNVSVPTLYNLLAAKFGSNYYRQTYFLPLITATSSYQLPFDFKDLLGVDAALDNTGVNWTPIRPYEESERDMYAYATTVTTGVNGFTNLRYQLQGQNLSFIPSQGPYPSQVRIIYIPQCPILVPTLPAAYATVTGFGQFSYAAVANLTVNGLTTTQVFQALVPGVSGGSAPPWNVPGTTTDNTLVWAYIAPLSSFATSFDGISGWEEYAVLDCAIKCGLKMEQDVSGFVAERERIAQRIEWESTNRQANDPFYVIGGFGTMENAGPYGPGGGFGL